jgi:ribosomal protein S18 acetylase RimI-like enzyme
MLIRPARPEDSEAIWKILRPAIRAAETYALPPDMTRRTALTYWLAPAHEVFVAERDGAILGTYYLRTNHPGGGAHVANCGYITAPEAQGRGVARAMCEHSLGRARERGFRAMQFNFVVASNTRAVALWRGLGFTVVGTLPGAFAHPKLGSVDALVMFREL